MIGTAVADCYVLVVYVMERHGSHGELCQREAWSGWAVMERRGNVGHGRVLLGMAVTEGMAVARQSADRPGSPRQQWNG